MNSQSNELQKRMSELNDETLLKIVEVDDANYRQDALDCAKQELASRGIAFSEPVEEEPEEKPNDFHPELVTIATYTIPYKAQLAKGLLEANDIPAFAADEHLSSINWLYVNAIGGIRLQVTEDNAEQAKALLAMENEPLSEDFDPSAV
ncbi:MAG: putative signal transducing protein [Blastocatellia bacterium]